MSDRTAIRLFSISPHRALLSQQVNDINVHFTITFLEKTMHNSNFGNRWSVGLEYAISDESRESSGARSSEIA